MGAGGPGPCILGPNGLPVRLGEWRIDRTPPQGEMQSSAVSAGHAMVAGRWRLVREIGRGGFGTVVEAWDEKIGRRVAVKLVDRRALELAGGMHRFNREAKVLQRLAHPNIVRAFDAGEHEGTPYLVMEFLEGAPLDAALRSEGAMRVERVAAIASDLLGALEEAHRFGVVHRDIKPANVFLTTSGGREVAKLLDFGIAKADGLDVAQTAMGATLGTAAYMAPEQVNGGKVGPAADLFAVGLLVAEALTGTRVYGGGSGLAILVAKAAGKPVVVPPTVLASSLGAVVTRAVAIDPAARFASAREMIDALGVALGRTLPSAGGPASVPALSADPLGATAPTAELRRMAEGASGATWSASAAPLPIAGAPRPSGADLAAHAFAVGPTHHGDEPPHVPVAPSPEGSDEPRTTRAPMRSRRRLWIGIAVASLVLGGGVAAAIVWGIAPSPRASGPRIVLEAVEGPLRIVDRDRQMILPGSKATSKDGLTIGAGNFPKEAIVDCPRLATATIEDVSARLRSFGVVEEAYRGKMITEWLVTRGEEERSVELYRLGGVKIEGLPASTVVAELGERLRTQGPVLRGGLNVLSLPAGTLADVARKAICE